VRVPPLLLQPLVENAIKHGVSPLKRGGRVSFGARAEGSVPQGERPMLHVWVRDTGVGIDTAAGSWRRAGGLGLSNVERRLQRHFDGAASLRITGMPGAGTTVDLLLPPVA
jgi:sensor histidine kinase YesM